MTIDRGVPSAPHRRLSGAMTGRLTSLAVRSHRRVLIIASIVVVIAAAFGLPVLAILTTEQSDFEDPAAQSQQVLRVIEHATGQAGYDGVAALVPATTDVRLRPAAAALAARVGALLSGQRGFERVLDYPSTHLADLISNDGRQTVVLAAFATRKDSSDAVKAIQPALRGRGVIFGGNDVTVTALESQTTKDLAFAETLALPLLLVLSFLVFRGVLAAALPLLVGVAAILVAFAVMRAVNQLTGLSTFALNLVSGMGLGLGIDYSLFVLSRYREEIARGAEIPMAIRRTIETAGRTVLYSSLTVAAALACLCLFPMRFLYSMGIGGVVVVLAASTVSLLVLPSILVVLGTRLDSLAPAWLRAASARVVLPSEQGRWASFARMVMVRPGMIALVTVGVLVVIALPVLHLQIAPEDARTLPPSAPVHKVAEALSHDYPVDGSQTITTTVSAPSSAGAAVGMVAARAASLAGQRALPGRARYLGRHTWIIELLPRGAFASAPTQRLVGQLRSLRLASAAGGPATPVLVGGATASFVDQKSAVAAHAPATLVALVLVTGGLLFLMSGSVILPFIALGMNLLTVAVSAGLLVLIFQDGHLSSLLGFAPLGGLDENMLVLLFVVTFALSTDYGVFLVARIKEARDNGMAVRHAVAAGMERTGRLITAAAILFCVAIGTFATSEIVFVKQFGVGAALAVAIDATLVRALLLPSLIACLGERAWWAPAPLRHVHARLGLGHLAGAHGE